MWDGTKSNITREKNMKKNIVINDEYETMNMSLDVAIQ